MQRCGEGSPAQEHTLGQGWPLGPGQRTRAYPGCSEEWRSPLLDPGWVWGGLAQRMTFLLPPVPGPVVT